MKGDVFYRTAPVVHAAGLSAWIVLLIAALTAVAAGLAVYRVRAGRRM